MLVHAQRVLRADVPTVNRFKGTSSSKKGTQDHEIVRKIGKRADYQIEVSAIFTMRLDQFFPCFTSITILIVQKLMIGHVSKYNYRLKT